MHAIHLKFSLKVTIQQILPCFLRNLLLQTLVNLTNIAIITNKSSLHKKGLRTWGGWYATFAAIAPATLIYLWCQCVCLSLSLSSVTFFHE